MPRMLTMIVRHRLAFLTGVLVTAIVLAVLGQLDLRVVSLAATGALIVLCLALLVAGLAALSAQRFPAFAERKGDFTLPPRAARALSVAVSTAVTVLIANQSL